MLYTFILQNVSCNICNICSLVTYVTKDLEKRLPKIEVYDLK